MTQSCHHSGGIKCQVTNTVDTNSLDTNKYVDEQISFFNLIIYYYNRFLHYRKKLLLFVL